MGHRFFHPDHLLEPLGAGWVMIQANEVIGAVVPLGSGCFGAFMKDGDSAVPVSGRVTSRARAAVILWNSTHTVRWGDRS